MTNKQTRKYNAGRVSATRSLTLFFVSPVFWSCGRRAQLASLGAAGQVALKAADALWAGVEKAQEALIAAKEEQDGFKDELEKTVVKVLKNKKAAKANPMVVLGLASLAAVAADAASEQVNTVATPLSTWKKMRFLVTLACRGNVFSLSRHPSLLSTVL